MKKFALCLVALLALCVSACGGGGGSGSGSGAVVLNDPAQIFVNIPAGNNNVTYLNMGLFTKTTDGLQLDADVLDSFSDLATARTVNFPSGDNSVYRDHGTEIRASAQTSVTLNEAVRHHLLNGVAVGEAVITDSIRLGGLKNGLKYSDFGLWQMDMAFNGTLNDKAASMSGTLAYYGFNFGDSSKLIAFTADSGTETFTGTALAAAWDYTDSNNPRNVQLSGKAILAVDTTALASGGRLDLQFANFYDFTVSNIDMIIYNDYFTTSDLDAPRITPNGTNGSGIQFSDGELQGPIAGNVYGNGRPEEVVGDFNFYTTDAGKGIAGGFGVHQYPDATIPPSVIP